MGLSAESFSLLNNLSRFRKEDQMLLSLLFQTLSVGAEESYIGMGTLKCYGDSRISENGTFSCTPSTPWAPFAPPQGLIADGEDGSHWVIVDDRGFGDCQFNSEEDLECYHDYDYQYCCEDVECNRSTVTPINPTRNCGFCACTGLLNIHCSMEFGCHG